jgi:uncharacterized protein (DUF433 family)
MPKKQKRQLGRYIVADPAICHGKPTFRGTRIMVRQVLKQVAKGMSWDAITDQWRGDVTREAIAEAVAIRVGRMPAVRNLTQRRKGAKKTA